MCKHIRANLLDVQETYISVAQQRRSREYFVTRRRKNEGVTRFAIMGLCIGGPRTISFSRCGRLQV